MVSAGELLIASPGMHEATFDRTVILLLDHDDDGSMGLILNRPSRIPVAEALPSMAGLAQPGMLFLGGPVEEGTALVLAEPHDPASPDLHFMRDGVGLMDLGENTDSPDISLARVRVFSGYAGWGEGQLEHELQAGAWITADAFPTDIWHTDSDSLWAAVLGRQEGLTRFLAAYPDQPWLN